MYALKWKSRIVGMGLGKNGYEIYADQMKKFVKKIKRKKQKTAERKKSNK